MPNHERELQDETRSQTECEACSIKSFLNNGITNDEKKSFGALYLFMWPHLACGVPLLNGDE